MNVKENLKAYLDGELNEQDRAQVEQAIAQDPSLQQELDQLSGLSTMLKAMAKPVEVKGYEATRDRLTKAAKPSLAFVWRTLGAVAVVSILATMFFPVFAQTKEAAMQTMAKSADAAASPTAADKNIYRPRAEAGASLKGERSVNGGGFETFNGGVIDGADDPNVASASSIADSPSDSDTAGMVLNKYQAKAKASADAEKKSMSANPAPGNNTYHPGLTLNGGHDIVRNADLGVKVDDVKAADVQVKAIASRSGGYVESSSVYAPSGEDVVRTATYSLRVDSHFFDRAVGQLSALGEVLSVSTSGDDITAQIVDTDARLKAMHAEEDQYLTVLKSAHQIGDILEVKDRLANVRQRIESLEAQKKNFKSLAELSTINVSLTEGDATPKKKKVDEDDWVGNSVKNAGDILGAVGKFIAQSLIYAAILIPIWVPVLLIGFWSYRKTKS